MSADEDHPHTGKGKQRSSRAPPEMLELSFTDAHLQSPQDLLANGVPRSSEPVTSLTERLDSSSQGCEKRNNGERLQGVCIDLGDPFTFEPFRHQDQAIRVARPALGLRRRPYQSGATATNTSEVAEGRTTPIDHASIFSGLSSDMPGLSLLPSLNESVSSGALCDMCARAVVRLLI